MEKFGQVVFLTGSFILCILLSVLADFWIRANITKNKCERISNVYECVMFYKPKETSQ